MLKKIAVVCALPFLVTACGSNGDKGATIVSVKNTVSKEMQAKNAAVWKKRKLVRYNDKAFDVAVATDKTYALVAPKAQDFSYTAMDIEGSVTKATACTAKFKSGLLSYIPGFDRSSDLREIEAKTADFKYWTVRVTC